MFRTGSGYLLPRYNTTRSSTRMVQYYDGVDGIDSGSEENARRFVEREIWKLSPDSSTDDSEASSDSEESTSSADDEPQDKTPDAEKLRARFAALLTAFPNHTMQIKAAAYQAGIYQPTKSVAYDPQINSFFRVMDDIDEKKLPEALAEFFKDLRDYSAHCIQRDNALHFSKKNLE